MAKFWALVVLIICADSYSTNAANSTSPAVKLRLTTSGLSYANDVATGFLQAQMSKLSFADFSFDITGGPGHGRLTLHNIVMTSVSLPRFTFVLTPPNQVIWSAQGGSAQIEGRWDVGYKISWWAHFSGNGKFDISAVQLDLTVGFQLLSDGSGQPQIQYRSCKAMFRSVDIHVGGGAVGWLINLFADELGRLMRKKLESAVCEQVKILVSIRANNMLKTMRTHVPLGKRLVLDYSLTSSPIVSPVYIDSFYKGLVSWNGSEIPPFNPDHMPDTPEPSTLMIYLWMSDYVLNSLLWSAHKHNLSQVVVSRSTIPSLAPFLRTSCGSMELCVGRISPVINKRYPNSYVQLHLETTEAPYMTINPKMSTMNASAFLCVYAEGPGGNLDQVLDVNLETSSDLLPHMSNEKIWASITVQSLEVKVTRSTIGTVSPNGVRVIASLAKPILQYLVNRRLKDGFPLSMIRGVRIKKTEMRLVSHALMLGIDVDIGGMRNDW